MPHGPEHHIEHAEHAQHAAHNPFDKRVTLSIAIVAAILACVTMLGHRAHNQTLMLQGEAIQAQTEAGIEHSKVTNKWAHFQALNIRSHMYRANQEMLDEIFRAQGKGTPSSKSAKRWKSQEDKYEATMPGLEKDARGIEETVKKYQDLAKKKIADSHEAHLRADRFDYGELGVEFAVVLCSLALLTKRNGFWYVGLLSCLLGTLVALSGLLGLFLEHAH